jgi:tellurite methyltransferase
MSDADRKKWNDKYREKSPQREPSPLLTRLAFSLPSRGRVLDIAGGGGRHAVWLAQQGMQVTVCDISSAGLAHARAWAADCDVEIDTIEHDLESLGLPAGPWDGIVSFLYLQRSLFPQFVEQLSEHGWLVVCQPTVLNLERHSHPSQRFLLEPGELKELVAGLQILHYEEGWLDDGRHDAIVLAQQP